MDPLLVAVSDLVVKNLTPYYDLLRMPNVKIYGNELVFKCYQNESDLSLTKVIEVVHVEDQLLIPTIFTPHALREKGIGKRLIHDVYVLGKEHGCHTIIVDMVQSFYHRMIARGGVPLDFETILITDETRLID